MDNVYQHTFDRMKERVEEYYSWFPEDAELATRIAEHLRTHKEYLPTGERLTDHRFQMAGHFWVAAGVSAVCTTSWRPLSLRVTTTSPISS